MRSSLIALLVVVGGCGQGAQEVDPGAEGDAAQQSDALTLLPPCLPHKTRPADVTITMGPTNSSKTATSPYFVYPTGLFGLCQRYVVDLNVTADPSGSGHPIGLAAGGVLIPVPSNAIDSYFAFPGFEGGEAASIASCEAYSVYATIYRKVGSGDFADFKNVHFVGVWQSGMCVPRDAAQNIYAPQITTIAPPTFGTVTYRFVMAAAAGNGPTKVGMRAWHE